MEPRLITLGWREWVALPELGIPRIKAKIDTGARTSCLHTHRIQPTSHQGEPWLRLWMHTDQSEERQSQYEVKVLDQREVTDSGGHTELRYVISTPVKLGDIEVPVEVTLTNRDSMRFRMLIGRTAMRSKFVVDPAQSFLLGDLP